MNRIICPLAAVILTVLLLNNLGAGDKAVPKQFLPMDAYTELSERSIKTIRLLAKSDAKDAAEKIEFEAVVLAGYTLAAKNTGAENVMTLRGSALNVAKSARKGNLGKLADGLTKGTTNGPAQVKDWRVYLQDLQWMMETFRNKSKGGEGIHADLQYHPKLKNLNGIEALIGGLSGKKLSNDNAAKVSKELSLLGYRIAVIGVITREFAPEKGAGQWRGLADQMTDASLSLSTAAHRKDADGILKAAVSLEGSCTQCHSAFKGK